MASKMLKIQPMTRLRNGLGFHGLYGTATTTDGRTLRAFIAGEVIGTAVTEAGAKNGRWTVTSAGTAEAARTQFASFFQGLAMDAVAIDLTASDVERLKRGVILTGIYPLQGLLDTAADRLANGPFEVAEQ